MIIRLFLLLLIFSNASNNFFAQKPNILPKNEYGLIVISEKKDFKTSIQADSNRKMIALQSFINTIVFDFVYADTSNFTHKKLYKKPVAFLRLPAVKALKNVCDELKTMGLGIKIWDAYRPYSVTKEMWKMVPDERYAANPAKGSGHNRGAAVDVTLIYLSNKQELKMPTTFDDFSEKAHHNYQNLAPEILKNRQLLKSIMEKHGFIALETEWWHYFLPQASQRFDLLDIDFSKLVKWSK
ncbi:MAG: M15 family metallopeptidase [Chitinophagaceae bacterium]